MFPLLPIGLALTGASILGNGIANRQVAKAREGVAAAEVDRQRRYRAQAESALGDALKSWDMGNANQGIDKAQQQLTASNQAAIAPTGGPATPTLTGEAPSAIAQVYQDAVAKQQQAGGEDAQRRAALGALQQWMQGQNIGMSRAGQQIGQAASFSQGSSNVLPAEFAQANNKGAGLRGVSNLAGNLGWAATLGGLWQDPATAAAYQTAVRRDPLTGLGYGGV
jgi:hypothetical protein